MFRVFRVFRVFQVFRVFRVFQVLRKKDPAGVVVGSWVGIIRDWDYSRVGISVDFHRPCRLQYSYTAFTFSPQSQYTASAGLAGSR